MKTEYHINSLSDFLEVPHEKQAECLEDFAAWLDMCRKKDELQSALSKEFPGLSPQLSVDGFVWIDDGKRGISDVSFTVNGEEIARAGGDEL